MQEKDLTGPRPFDLDGLFSVMARDPFPIECLKGAVGPVRRAAALGAPTDPVALFLAEQASDAGLFSLDDDLAVRLSSLDRAGLVRLDFQVPAPPPAVRSAVRAVEAALNGAIDAESRLADEPGLGLADLYRLRDEAERSLFLEAAAMDPAGRPVEDDWGCRRAVAVGLDSLRLPYRVSSEYRLNLAEGLVAFAVETPGPDVMAARVWDGDGAVVEGAAGREARARAYARSVAVLMAALAFSAARPVAEVWVNVRVESRGRVAAAVSWKVTREAFTTVDVASFPDAGALLTALGASVAQKGSVTPLFSLDDPRLSPSWRHDAPETSGRPLAEGAGAALGARRVSDLAIRPDGRRTALADELCRRLGGSTEADVAAVLGLTRDDPDPDVRDAGVRVAGALVTGELDSSEPDAVLEAFRGDDGLRHLVRRAFSLLARKGTATYEELSSAAAGLADALAAVDGEGRYRDDEKRVWRHFNTYAERSLYNRLAQGGPEVALVPGAYYLGHGALTSLLMALGRPDEALAHALRARDLAPMDANARLRVARCYERMNDAPMAEVTITELLDLAHDPDSICAAYYRLASTLERQGEPRLADACLRHAEALGGSCAPLAARARERLESQGDFAVADGEVLPVLEHAQIPIAPVPRVGDALVAGAKAATDAGVFPVARDLTALVGLLTSDESLLEMALSLDGVPDRG